MAIRTLDMVHATTGLPWWATIIATTFAVRTIFFPITVISVRHTMAYDMFEDIFIYQSARGIVVSNNSCHCRL